MTGEKYTSLEALSASLATVWGLFVANPFYDTFQTASRIYTPLVGLVPYELFWGLLFIALGLAGMFLIFTDRKTAAARLMFITFTGIGVLFFIGDSRSQAWGIYGLIGVFNLIHWRYAKWKTRISS